MTDPNNLLLLAERVEMAEGPNRKLDAEIAGSLGWGCVMQDPQSGDKWICWRKHYRSGEWITLPYYTASLDAAMTLVPEGFMWRVQSWPDGVNCAILEKDAGDFGAIDARHTETFAQSPALALTAACLRALAQGGSDVR